MKDNTIGIVLTIGIILWWVLFFILYPYITTYLGIPDNTPKTREGIISYIWFMVILVGGCIGIPVLYALFIVYIRRS